MHFYIFVNINTMSSSDFKLFVGQFKNKYLSLMREKRLQCVFVLKIIKKRVIKHHRHSPPLASGVLCFERFPSCVHFRVKLYAWKNFESQTRPLYLRVHLGDIVPLFELTLNVLCLVVKYNTVALVCCC